MSKDDSSRAFWISFVRVSDQAKFEAVFSSILQAIRTLGGKLIVNIRLKHHQYAEGTTSRDFEWLFAMEFGSMEQGRAWLQEESYKQYSAVTAGPSALFRGSSKNIIPDPGLKQNIDPSS